MKYTKFNPRPFEAHRIVYDLIPEHTRVLDLGCATGYMAKELKRKVCRVVGVERDPAAAERARDYCDRVIVGDLEQSNGLPIPRASFDVVLLLDVLEHILARNELLAHIHIWMKPSGTLIISTPNIAHILIRLRLLFGDFTYQRWGILDETHVHFFTKKTLVALLETSGYRCEKIIPTADFGQLPLIGRIVRGIPKTLQFALTRVYSQVLGVQYIAVCRINKKYGS